MSTKTELYPCMDFKLVARKIFFCILTNCDGVHHYYRRAE